LHPDFTLQAVKPYPDVMKDVYAAMSAEPNPPLSAPTSLGTDPAQPVDKWLDVCTALVADTSTWSITRVSLRRLVRFVRQASAAAGGSVLTPLGMPGTPTTAANAAVAASRSAYGNPYSQPVPVLSAITTAANTAAAATVPPSVMTTSATTTFAEFVLDEQFTETRITDVDSALADVVERVISAVASPSKSQSTTSSRSSSCRGRADDSSAPNQPLQQQQSQQQQKPAAGGAHDTHSPRDAGALILGQLEAIAADMARHRLDRNGSAGPAVQPVVVVADTTLKEGVRAWLEEVEVKNAAAEAAKVQNQASTTGPEPEAKEQGGLGRNGQNGSANVERQTVDGHAKGK
jgi:hypothetical protein